jgi:hypothetical protein
MKKNACFAGFAAALIFAAALTACNSGLDEIPAADDPALGIMSEATAMNIFNYDVLPQGGVGITKFKSAGALRTYLNSAPTASIGARSGTARAAGTGTYTLFLCKIGSWDIVDIASGAFTPDPENPDADIRTVVAVIKLPQTLLDKLPAVVIAELRSTFTTVETGDNPGDGTLTLGGLVYDATGGGEAVPYSGSDTVVVYAGNDEELGRTALTSAGFNITITNKPLTLYAPSPTSPLHIFGNWQGLTADPPEVRVAEVYLRTLGSSNQVVKSNVTESGPPEDFTAKYAYLQYLYVSDDVTITLQGETRNGVYDYGGIGTRWSNDATLELTKGWNALCTVHDVVSDAITFTEEISISVESPYLVWIMN